MLQQLDSAIAFAVVMLTLSLITTAVVQVVLAKACRKNYTLQNPDSCRRPDFRGFGW